jgi:hypothetical protein
MLVTKPDMRDRISWDAIGSIAKTMSYARD